jgi:hypothetical protein
MPSPPAFEVGRLLRFCGIGDHSWASRGGDVSGKGCRPLYDGGQGIFGRWAECIVPAILSSRRTRPCRVVDKHAFVSLSMRAGCQTGSLTLPRGPLPHAVPGQVNTSSGGMGIRFNGDLQQCHREYALSLREGDLCVFYTDGI